MLLESKALFSNNLFHTNLLTLLTVINSHSLMTGGYKIGCFDIFGMLAPPPPPQASDGYNITKHYHFKFEIKGLGTGDGLKFNYFQQLITC